MPPALGDRTQAGARPGGFEHGLALGAVDALADEHGGDGSGARDGGQRRMHDSGDYSISDFAELFPISRQTVYRTLRRQPTATRDHDIKLAE